jgi:hypothetical protein
MIANLYVDHMLSSPATSSDDVLAATRDHSKLFADAAARIGLTPAEYREFKLDLLDGKAMYVRLPRRVDAMAGNRRGSVYAVHNAVMSERVMGWRVALSDGNVVYVPQICGNISVVRHVGIAAVPKPKVIAHKPVFVPAIGTVAETPVIVTPPAAVPLAAPPVAVAALPAAAVAPAAEHPPFFLFGIPAIIGGIVAGVSHPGGPTPVVPPCTQGSNLQNACQR